MLRLARPDFFVVSINCCSLIFIHVFVPGLVECLLYNQA